MSKKPQQRHMPKPTASISVSNVRNVSGEINIAGRDIRKRTTIRQGASAEVIAQALAEALVKTKKRPKTTRAKKTEIEQEVRAIESELGQKKADKGFLAERFRNLAKMAPDILEVIIAGLGNPAAGVGMVAKKIAEKAKAEAEKESAAP